jgi:hypothetical protein
METLVHPASRWIGIIMSIMLSFTLGIKMANIGVRMKLWKSSGTHLVPRRNFAACNVLTYERLKAKPYDLKHEDTRMS